MRSCLLNPVFPRSTGLVIDHQHRTVQQGQSVDGAVEDGGVPQQGPEGELAGQVAFFGGLPQPRDRRRCSQVPQKSRNVIPVSGADGPARLQQLPGEGVQVVTGGALRVYPPQIRRPLQDGVDQGALLPGLKPFPGLFPAGGRLPLPCHQPVRPAYVLEIIAAGAGCQGVQRRGGYHRRHEGGCRRHAPQVGIERLDSGGLAPDDVLAIPPCQLPDPGTDMKADRYAVHVEELGDVLACPFPLQVEDIPQPVQGGTPLLLAAGTPVDRRDAGHDQMAPGPGHGHVAQPLLLPPLPLQVLFLEFLELEDLFAGRGAVPVFEADPAQLPAVEPDDAVVPAVTCVSEIGQDHQGELQPLGRVHGHDANRIHPLLLDGSLRLSGFPFLLLLEEAREPGDVTAPDLLEVSGQVHQQVQVGQPLTAVRGGGEDSCVIVMVDEAPDEDLQGLAAGGAPQPVQTLAKENQPGVESLVQFAGFRRGPAPGGRGGSGQTGDEGP